MTARLTEEAVEVVVQPAPPIRLSEEAVEVVVAPSPTTRLSATAVEVVVSPIVNVDETRLGLLGLTDAHTKALGVLVRTPVARVGTF